MSHDARWFPSLASAAPPGLRFLALCAATGIVFQAGAAYTVPAELQRQATREQIDRYQETVANSAKPEQTVAADRAYRERLAFRRTLAKALQASLEQRRQEFDAPPVTNEPGSVPTEFLPWPVIACTAGLLAAGWLLVQLYRRQPRNAPVRSMGPDIGAGN